MPTAKQLAFSKEFLFQCTGYDEKFIDGKTRLQLLKVLPQKFKSSLPKVEKNTDGELKYTALSVLYNAKRKVPFVAAYNIDGADKPKKSTRPPFVQDPRIKGACQLDNPFYDLRTDITEFEIGHMASNNEMGRGKNGDIKAFQTFHFTNSVPQAERLNSGLWRSLESYIIKEASTVTKNKKIAVFTGPILTSKDPAYIRMPSFKIPLLFYKVIVFQTPAGLFSTGFLMSHEKRMIEQGMFVKPPIRKTRGGREEIGFFNDFAFSKVFQVNIPFLEQLSGLNFSWSKVKPVTVPEKKKQIGVIKGITNAAEAKAASRKTRMPAKAQVVEPTDKELKSGNFLLNIVLPE